MSETNLSEIHLTPNTSDERPNPDLGLDLEANTRTELESSSTFLKCGGYLMGIILVLGVIGCVITYIVYIIISLCETSYNEQKKVCEKSNVWLYLLLGLIVSPLIQLTNKKSDKDKKTLNPIQILVAIGFIMWGCYELFGVSCIRNLSETLLYTMLKVSVGVNLVIIGILFLGCLVLCFGKLI